MLVAFDFDGALVRSDPYIRLGEQHGTGEEVAAVLDRTATGDLGFEAGLRSIADHLAGLPVDDAAHAYEHLRPRPEASDLVGELHRADHHVAIVSHAPEQAIRATLSSDALDVDTVVANRLPEANDALTGDIEGPLVDTGKGQALKRLALEQGRSLDETVAVGEDRSDLSMIQFAGIGVGLDPDPVVESQADVTVPSLSRLEETFRERSLL